ncbi:hypothetical protein [Roseicella aquatilis]|uniref:Uncharacterized protein n=1 Tax=Roseicella aquatilis TaxID=2527868 RepID=A0A4R4D974_9PROT|nr:hypothetical protein [Roseicella aquatilis]TCZ56645.1 hypothetical protein EXY23_19850 [Roseicella aquatilis]
MEFDTALARLRDLAGSALALLPGRLVAPGLFLPLAQAVRRAAGRGNGAADGDAAPVARWQRPAFGSPGPISAPPSGCGRQ